jgi:short-subunit dehydrogenase
MSEQTCLIIGAGKTMGTKIAHAFGAEGFSIGLVAREKSHLDELAGSVGERAPSVATFTADVTKDESVNALGGAVEKELGTPDVVIYNPAVIESVKPSEMEHDSLINSLEVNFFGAMRCVHVFLPGLRSRGSGTLLFTGGGFGIDPAIEFATHSIGKAALRNYAHGLFKELGPEGIHAATVTITAPVREGTEFDGDVIAAHYVALHRQSPEGRQWEIVHK